MRCLFRIAQDSMVCIETLDRRTSIGACAIAFINSVFGLFATNAGLTAEAALDPLRALLVF